MPLIIFLAAATIYLLPGLIAVLRDRRRHWSIVALNVVLGWTIVGWIGALVWACRNPRPATLPAARKPWARVRFPTRRRAGAAGGPANDNRAAQASVADREIDLPEAGNDYAEWLEAGEGLSRPPREAANPAPRSAA